MGMDKGTAMTARTGQAGSRAVWRIAAGLVLVIGVTMLAALPAAAQDPARAGYVLPALTMVGEPGMATVLRVAGVAQAEWVKKTAGRARRADGVVRMSGADAAAS